MVGGNSLSGVPAMPVIILLVSILSLVNGHGILFDPPGRSYMSEFGFDVPENYDASGLNCGGQQAQHFDEVNQGRCGECGDEWKLARPRPNDEGGLYGTGIIGQTYVEGSLIRVTIEVTANHLGYFEFRLCPKKSAEELVTQECLDRNLLELVEMPGQGDGIVDGTKFHIGGTTGKFFPTIKLPAGITCENCVLQWYWTTGNSPGQCPNGGIGLCYQESFVNCADIAIIPLQK